MTKIEVFLGYADTPITYPTNVFNNGQGRVS
jgi:hypothetical protein